jgi:hypothetical protein
MVHVAIPGFRVQELVIVTTLTDEKRYPKEEIASLFRGCNRRCALPHAAQLAYSEA